MSEPTQSTAGDRPSEDEIRQYVQQLRSAPADQVLSEILFSLLNAAQAKLGRRDARLLIDLSAAVVEHARPYLAAELTGQLDEVLGQLRLGQVQAESRAAGREPEPNDLTDIPGHAAGGPAPGGPDSPAAPTPPAAPTRPAAPRSEPPPRLWVPGRDF